MTNLINPVPIFSLPLSLGQDLVVDFQNEDTSGNPVDYPMGTVVTFIIEGATPVNATAAVSGNHANVFVPFTTTDQIVTRSRWRCIITVPGSPAVHIAACNGTVSRSDGD